MYFVNEYDVSYWVRRNNRPGFPEQPNVIKATAVLARLIDWTNGHSDGWAYWPLPMKAATRLARELEARFNARGWESREINAEDISDAHLAKLLIPIKAFMTRQVGFRNMTDADRTYILEGRRG